MPATSLSDAIANWTSSAAGSFAPTERIQWFEAFTDKPRVSEFNEETDPAGFLESNSSTGHSEYQDRLRAIALRKEGKEKAEIAAAIGRSTKFVQQWWRKEPKEVPKPPGVHEYLKTEFWRDIQIVRGFGHGQGVYEAALAATDFVDNMADGPEFRGGGSRLKYDKEGRMRPNGSQISRDGLLPGRVPQLDKIVQRMLSEQGIDDRVLKRPGLLWYPDGSAMAIPHRHEAWTALLSFGNSRILTIDNHPVLLRDGDLIVFGTQRHGVPKMCTEGSALEDYGGRISVVFFFMPTGQQAKGSEPWKAIMDSDTPSRKMVAMQRDANLGGAAELEAIRSGPHGASLAELVTLGFLEDAAAAALKAMRFDVERAAEALLLGGEDTLLTGSSGARATNQAQIAMLYSRLSEIQVAKSMHVCSVEANEEAEEGEDEAFARQLQMEESGFACGSSAEVEWEERAILEQLQDLEELAEQGPGVDNQALRTRFAQYDQMLDAEDADNWDERGDLMARHWRREHLQIEQQEPAVLYSFGCDPLMQERELFELLSLHSVRVLYDLRANPDVGSRLFLKPSNLERSFKARGLTYKHVALGRESSYGVIKHLKEDEGRNTLAELVWHGRRRRSAFLGAEADWRDDHRIAIGATLLRAGHRVLHVRRDGSTEEQAIDMEMPELLIGEEAKLRVLEKQRRAGELNKPHKSAVSRSSEVIASKLTGPRVEIDVGAELRRANTQRELCNIQRRLADLQRRSETSDAKAGMGPKLVGVNKWLRAEAEKQKAFLSEGKTKDGKERPKRAPLADQEVLFPSPQVFASSSSASASIGAGAGHVVLPSGGERHTALPCSCCRELVPADELEDLGGVCAVCLCAAAESQEPLANLEGGQAPSAAALDAPAEEFVQEERPVLAKGSACSAAHGPADTGANFNDAPRRSTWRARRSQRAHDS